MTTPDSEWPLAESIPAGIPDLTDAEAHAFENALRDEPRNVVEAKQKLAKAQAWLVRAEKRSATANAKEESATPGGLRDYDPALLSGIRRKRNPKADQRRFDAYSRAASASRSLDEARREVVFAERSLALAESAPPKPTAEEIRAATLVRDQFGWHRVVRVNAKSVTVHTPYSWTDRIAIDAILEARP